MFYGDINAEIQRRRASAGTMSTNINAEIQRRRASATVAPIPGGRTGISSQLRYIPTQTSIAREPIARESIFGGSALPRPPPRPGAVSPSTLAPAGAFGGANGGMGAGALGPTTLSGISSSVSKMGVGITNTLGTLIPLAIKIILAVIVIKIVLWLVRGRRR